MSDRFRTCAILFAFLLWCAAGATSYAQTDSVASHSKGNTVTKHASGAFDVKLTPQPDNVGDPAIGRMSIDKQFHGDLEGSSKGQMLAHMTSVKGSAGYVAVEKVSGTLGGRRGTFVLQHNATMDRGTPQLNIVVVPDSGTDQLVGLKGTMNIIITDGKHSYDFEYTLPDAQ